GPAERTRCVRALDDVVLGLRALRVSGEAAALAKTREVTAPGEQLVHVRLVTGVEDDGVARRVEDAVKGDRQLDDTEVGTEVSARLGDFRDEESADLLRELLELAGGEPIEVTGPREGLENRHSTTL